MVSRAEEIARLLAEAEAAHGAFQDRELGGEFDRNWPTWYAAYLLAHGLPTGADEPPTVAALSARLRQLDEEYRREQPAEEWRTYYAARLAGSLI